MVAKALLDLRKAQRLKLAAAAGEVVEARVEEIKVRRVPTLFVGILGGLIVGMTSVGSGSLMIVALLLLYPTIRAGQLVGTDLVQAVPLVASASLGHLLFGDFQLDLTASLLIGALPGVYVGARVSSSAPGGIVRRALVDRAAGVRAQAARRVHHRPGARARRPGRSSARCCGRRSTERPGPTWRTGRCATSCWLP